MLETIVAALAGLITATISAMGYPGILLLMAIESACIPLPSEIIMPFAGYLVSTGRFNLVLVATFGALGCNVGSTSRMHRHVRRPAADPEVGRLRPDRAGTIWTSPSTSLPATAASPCSRAACCRWSGPSSPCPPGMARMPQLRFQLYTFAGSWPWCYGLAYVGLKLGERWDTDPRLRAIMHQADAVIVVALVAGLAWYIWRHWRSRREG